jgi:hypothetical protein
MTNISLGPSERVQQEKGDDFEVHSSLLSLDQVDAPRRNSQTNKVHGPRPQDFQP